MLLPLLLPHPGKASAAKTAAKPKVIRFPVPTPKSPRPTIFHLTFAADCDSSTACAKGSSQRRVIRLAHGSSNDRQVQKLVFSSILPIAYRDELERIVFFNPEQDRVTKSLIDSVHRYGVPLIVEEEGILRFRVPAFGPVQTLYALDAINQPACLAGVVMFVRESLDTVLLLHVAVHEDYGAGGVHSGNWVTPRLLAAVRSACKRVRGITCLRLLYPHEIQVRLDRLSA